MSLTKAETENNFDSFSSHWKTELPKAIGTLEVHRDVFLKSYARIASLNAWRSDLLESLISQASLEFFTEALNDAVVSHVFARIGCWRSALMSLRSCIENACYCAYYKDHPVEIKLWETGKHRPGFAEIYSYLEQHPDINPLGVTPVNGLSVMREEYATLSRAVHASAKQFRMSPNVRDINLWQPEAPKLSQWKTREQRVLCSVNLLLLVLFKTELQGTQRSGLRKALAAVVPDSLHARIKLELKVTIPAT